MEGLKTAGSLLLGERRRKILSDCVREMKVFMTKFMHHLQLS